MITRKVQILNRMKQLEEELASLAQYPDDSEFEIGSVITFTMRFDTYGPLSRPYLYAAIKGTDGLWATTGPRSPKGYTWDELIDWFENNHVSKLEKVDPTQNIKLT